MITPHRSTRAPPERTAVERASVEEPPVAAGRGRPPLRESEAPAWHSLGVEAVLRALAVGPDGLDEREAAARLALHGRNVLRAAPPRSAWSVLASQFRSVVMLLLVAAMGLAWATGDRLDAAAIGVVLAMSAALGFVMELRARRTMEGLHRLDVPRATVLRAGARREVEAALLVPGDVVLLEAGSRVPADARLLGAAELQVVESSLTGESLPAGKRAEAVLPRDLPLADRVNMVYRGTLVAAGTGRA
ncbi:MAG TPA: cation-transporting P-type ATPase, partial [Longimicrobiaceae bacterium]|nr:cation-transporting P-type ATPase [Longimicrobiaceae bacterium]